MRTAGRTVQDTRDLILDAATQVFAQKGLKGATTREIAVAAEVNETTLFRHFKNKESLLNAVVERMVARQISSFSEFQDPSGDLYHDLLDYARSYYCLLEANKALTLTIIGETTRYRDHTNQIIYNAAQPLRNQLKDYLLQGQNSGIIRNNIHLDAVIDMFTGMLLAGLLRHTSFELSYSIEDYLQSCVQIFIQGIHRFPTRPPNNLNKTQ